MKEFGFFSEPKSTEQCFGPRRDIQCANAFRHLQQGRRRGWLWLLGLGACLLGFDPEFLTSGIILFFAGTLIWHIWWLFTSRAGTQKIIAWGPLAILIALLLLAGGAT